MTCYESLYAAIVGHGGEVDKILGQCNLKANQEEITNPSSSINKLNGMGVDKNLSKNT